MLTDTSLLPASASGRAYPDVAAQGSGFQVVVGGNVTSVGGTSASSPVCHPSKPTRVQSHTYAALSRLLLGYFLC